MVHLGEAGGEQDSIASAVLGNFQMIQSFCPHSVALGSGPLLLLTEMSTQEFP